MTTIEINRKHYRVPTAWNELTPSQLVQVMEVFYSGRYDEIQSRLKLLKIMTGMGWFAFLRAPAVTEERICLRPWVWPVLPLGVWLFQLRQVCMGLDEYLYLTDYFLEKNELTKQLLPVYRGFHGPADEMINLTGDEFAWTEHYYTEWKELGKKAVALAEEGKTPDAEMYKAERRLIDNLVAVLWRPMKKRYNLKRNKDGDPRIAFNANLSEYYAKTTVRRWPMLVKLAMVHYYEGCRKAWQDENPEIFGGDGPSDAVLKGMAGVIRDLADRGIYGKFEEVKQMDMPMILLELNVVLSEARKKTVNG